MTRPVDPIERGGRLLAELREATSEAAGLVGDLRRAMREARAQVDEYLHTEVQKSLDQTTELWQTLALDRAREIVTDINRTAETARSLAEAAIDRATGIQVMAARLADLIAERVVRTPYGGVINYGQLSDPDRLGS